MKENNNELEDFNDDKEDEIKMYNINNYKNHDLNENKDENNEDDNNIDNEEKEKENEKSNEEENDINNNQMEEEENKEDAGFINEDYIKKLMNYNVHNDVDDILNLNNKINSPNDILNNNIKEPENKKELEDEPETKKEMDEEEDEREIYKMFEDKLYKNAFSNNMEKQKDKIQNEKETKPIQITSIKNQQSRLMNKYFSNALNNNNNKKNNNNSKNLNQNNNNKKITIKK